MIADPPLVAGAAQLAVAVTAPPGAPANRLAYKTGTSYGHRDTWAIGYDGRHVVGVWLGRADGTPVPGVFGADLAAPVLFQTFARIAPRLEELRRAGQVQLGDAGEQQEGDVHWAKVAEAV